MRPLWGYIALFAALAAVLGFFVYAVVESQGTSQTVSIAELRAGGVDFVLEGVRIHEPSFWEFPGMDGSSQAVFQVTFPDGAQESLTFFFGGWCTSGSTIDVSTDHRNPAAFFTYTCGEDSIRVRVV